MSDSTHLQDKHHGEVTTTKKKKSHILSPTCFCKMFDSMLHTLHKTFDMISRTSWITTLFKECRCSPWTQMVVGWGNKCKNKLGCVTLYWWEVPSSLNRVWQGFYPMKRMMLHTADSWRLILLLLTQKHFGKKGKKKETDFLLASCKSQILLNADSHKAKHKPNK
jgi:hypothetical protein